MSASHAIPVTHCQICGACVEVCIKQESDLQRGRFGFLSEYKSGYKERRLFLINRTDRFQLRLLEIRATSREWPKSSKDLSKAKERHCSLDMPSTMIDSVGETPAVTLQETTMRRESLNWWSFFEIYEVLNAAVIAAIFLTIVVSIEFV